MEQLPDPFNGGPPSLMSDNRRYVIVPVSEMTEAMLEGTEHRQLSDCVRDNSGENLIVKFRPEKIKP